MIRQCFLCQHDVDPVFSATWALPGLAPAEIGFSVCPRCGSVCQSPSVPFRDMMTYYSNLAVYTNPGRGERPSDIKVRDVDEQIHFIRRGIGELPKSALQIGSSDGYTLHRFREAGIERVVGVEPGQASAELARRLYDIDCIQDSAEAFETDQRFDLILLTHVLEHFYEPQSVLAKCRQLHPVDGEGFVYVEVPLLAQSASLCPGFFSFEHINYYTRENLVESLVQVGYSPVSVVEHYNSNLAPVIGVLASTRRQNHIVTARVEPRAARENVETYRRQEVSYWQRRLDRLADELGRAQRLILWGAGIHTSQLVANTDLMERYHVDGLVDSSSLKWGVRQGDWTCVDPASIEWRPGDVILISSYASELEIYNALSPMRSAGCQTLKLHGD